MRQRGGTGRVCLGRGRRKAGGRRVGQAESEGKKSPLLSNFAFDIHVQTPVAQIKIPTTTGDEHSLNAQNGQLILCREYFGTVLCHPRETVVFT